MDILELVSSDPAREWPLAQIARSQGLHRATCANILKTLVARGALDQPQKRGGYRLGPLAYYLVRNGRYRQDLVAAAQPVMDDLAQSLGETVLLASMLGRRRFILAQARGSSSVEVSPDMLFLKDIYQTATGRVLLSHLDAHDLKAAVRELDLPPRRVWPKAAGAAERLVKALNAIRRTGWEVNDSAPDVVQFAVSVSPDGKPAAALGCFVPAYRCPPARRQAVLAQLRLAARRIEAPRPPRAAL
jgi:DNA-binding IclR family transcriptional regulator